MCGHVGAAGPLTGKHEKAIRQLLVLDSLRGEDSTGVAVVNRKGDDIIVAKQVGNPYELFATKQFDLAFKRINKVVIGHNRYATQGKVNKQNSHPYEFDSLVGAHNGTLTSKYCLADHTRFDVDSENLFHHIDKKGLKDALDNMSGAWALVWWDKYEEEIKFLRNKERPMWLTTTKDGVLFWASEAWMLEVILSRNDIEFSKPALLPEDTLYSFYVDEKGEVAKPRVAASPSTKKEYIYQGNSSNRWSGNGNHNQPNRNNTGNTNISNVVQLDPKNKGVTPSSVVASEEYSPLLEISLKVHGKARDKNGNDFYMCRDFVHIDRDIRLYIKHSDRSDLMNKIIGAKMHQYPFTMQGDPKKYWKVDHATVRLVTKIDSDKKPDLVTVIDAVVIDGKEQPDDLGRPFYHNIKGKLVPRNEWEKDHGVCGWCTGYVDPEQEYKFTMEGDSLCHLCAADSEVKKYVNLR